MINHDREGHTIAGTTDTPCPVTTSPGPSENDIQFILSEVKNYLTPDIDVRRGDVLSAWAGIRPLVKDPDAGDTASLVRNHVVHVSDSRLVTIAGGKWTTYRAMAAETVDAAVAASGLSAGPSMTDGLVLEGAHNWTPTMFIRLVQDLGVDTQVAQHLSGKDGKLIISFTYLNVVFISATYGDRAFSVGKMAQLTGMRWPIVGRRLHSDFPYIDAEVRYAVKVGERRAGPEERRLTVCPGVRCHGRGRHRPKTEALLPQRPGSGGGAACGGADHGGRAGLGQPGEGQADPGGRGLPQVPDGEGRQ